MIKVINLNIIGYMKVIGYMFLMKKEEYRDEIASVPKLQYYRSII